MSQDLFKKVKFVLTGTSLALVAGGTKLITVHDLMPDRSPSEHSRPQVAPPPKDWALEMASFSQIKSHLPKKDVVVAVIDTGVDIEHPALAKNIWINPGESGLDEHNNPKATNGIDDDKNGFVDDIHGWNFVANNNNLKDAHGHGTHIAGIIAAHPSERYPIQGLAPNAKIMVLKYYDTQHSSQNTLLNTIKAMEYAVKMGAEIINYSGGGTSYSRLEQTVLKKASQKNILVVAAAGNEKSNSDLHPYYPADYPLDNILSVTAINPQTRILASSNYGARSVDIAAPGHKVYSTLNDLQQGYMTGTSQATAVVTGVAALLKAHHPQLKKPEDLIHYLVQTGTRHPHLKGKTRSRAIINAHRALTMKDSRLDWQGQLTQ